MAELTQRRYLAHVQLRPHDGQPPYVVETEFQAVGYPSAWNHVLTLGRKFNATIMSHKLVEVDADGVIGGDSTTLSLPAAIAAEMPPPTLTVKDEEAASEWYGIAKYGLPKAIPFPYEEVSNDSVAS